MKVTVASSFSRRDVQSVELTEGSTIESLLISMQGRGDNTAFAYLPKTFLVNKEKADHGTILNDGDEVMILFSLVGG